MQAQNVSFLLSLVFAGVAGFTVLEAAAQPAAPALKYQSAFDGYTRFADEKRANWREINDTVGTLGGHAAHLRGDSQGMASDRPVANGPAASAVPVVPAPATPAVRPGLAADPHAGHGKGGAK